MPVVTGFISIGIFIAGRVIQLADSAQRNREKCSLLKVRVQMIKLLLTELQNHWTPDPVTGGLLQQLNDALDDGKALVESCQERRTWSLIFRTQKKARKFDVLGERISKILEMFHIANMVLIVKTNNRKNDAAGAAWASSSSSGGVVEPEVVRLAVSVVQEGKRMRQKQNREEVQELVQFVEQAATQMQQLQSSDLWWDPKTQALVDELKDLLQQASNILYHHNRPHRNSTRTKVAQAFSHAGTGGYSSLEPDHQILEVAYKIEYCVQVLPVITMHYRNA